MKLLFWFGLAFLCGLMAFVGFLLNLTDTTAIILFWIACAVVGGIYGSVMAHFVDEIF